MHVDQASTLVDRDRPVVGALPDAPGTYVMILQSRTPRSLPVGRLGCVELSPGYYLYVGSAFGPGGVRARLSHHLRVSVKPRWHIDYLRRIAEPVAVWFHVGDRRQEHVWASSVGRSHGMEVVIPRFGASDCRCESHLFFSETAPSLAAFRNGLLSVDSPEGVLEWTPSSATGVTGL